MAQAQQLQQALIAYDRVRRTTDIPLFYGRKGKDTITPSNCFFGLRKRHVLPDGMLFRTWISAKQIIFTFLSEIMLSIGTIRLTTSSDLIKKFGLN